MRNFNIHRIFRKGVKQRFPVINCCFRGLENSVSNARLSQQRLRACVRAYVRVCVRACVPVFFFIVNVMFWVFLLMLFCIEER